MMLARLNALRSLLVLVLAMILALPPVTAQARAGEARFALIVGNDGYEAAVPTAANDAGLIADTLRAANFDVSGARNLDRETLRASIREFVDKASNSGTDVVTFVYFAGYAVQFDGENYLVPVNARIDRAQDIPEEAIPLTEITAPLAELPGKARIVVLDAAHPGPYPKDGKDVAGGLAAIEPQERGFIAFNAAPGTVGPVEDGSYGTYASALTEMIRTGGLSIDDVFERVRLKVSDATKGAAVPWNVSKLSEPFFFLDLGRDAPKTAERKTIEYEKRPIRSFPAKDAYAVAVARDTLPVYQEYLEAYPQAPAAARVRVILAARREALTWQRAGAIGTPQAYWSYLRRYPRGPHGWDARRRLTLLRAAVEPPGEFEVVEFEGVPPPPPVEPTYIDDRRYISFGDYDLPPPPPPPVVFLPPPPPWWELPPPPAPVFAPYFLPAPRPFLPPTYVVVPRGVILPPPAPIYVQEGEGDRRGRRFAEAVVAGTVAGAAAAVLFRLPAIVQRRVESRDRIIQVRAPAAEPRREGERREPGRERGREREGRPRRLLPGQALPGARPVAQVQAPTQGAGAIPLSDARPALSPGSVRPADLSEGRGVAPPTGQRGGPRVGAPLPTGRDLPRPTKPRSAEPAERGPRTAPPELGQSGASKAPSVEREGPVRPGASGAGTSQPSGRALPGERGPDRAGAGSEGPRPSREPRHDGLGSQRMPGERGQNRTGPGPQSPAGVVEPRKPAAQPKDRPQLGPEGERHREPLTESGSPAGPHAAPAREPGAAPRLREPHASPANREPREPRAAPAIRELRDPRAAPAIREPRDQKAAPAVHEREPRAVPAVREPREPRATPAVREPREPRAAPAVREPREPRAAPAVREPREPRAAPTVREPREPRAAPTVREPREPRAAPAARELRIAPAVREPHEPRTAPAAREPREPKAAPAAREPREPRPAPHGREGGGREGGHPGERPPR